MILLMREREIRNGGGLREGVLEGFRGELFFPILILFFLFIYYVFYFYFYFSPSQSSFYDTMVRK